MYVEYKMETDKNYMILEAGCEEEKFSTRMLLENQISGLLGFERRSFNGEIYFFYDITGKHSLKSKVQKKLLQENDIRKLFQSLYCIVGNLHSYFLNLGGLLTETEYIYVEGNDYYFCYYPLREQNSTEEMLKLFAEQLLEIADHEDDGAVELVYRFYKIVKESEKGIMWILEDVLTREIVAEEPEPEEEINVYDDEPIEPEKKVFLKDPVTIICFFAVFLVSLCYLGTAVLPSVPKNALDAVASVFLFLSLPGIAVGFVDIERKK